MSEQEKIKASQGAKLAKKVKSEVKPEVNQRPNQAVKTDAVVATPREIGGPKGLEPTRYGDWEAKGRCYDF